jgi:hypothetical protein
MHTSPQHTNPLLKVIAIAFGVIVGLAVFAALLSGGDDAGYTEQSGYDYTVSDESPTGSGDTQYYDGGSITTTDDGELIYSDTNGNGFSSGG